MKTAPEGRRVRRLKRSATRCFLIGIAAISLLPILSTYVHLVLVQHATCPEHGEVIDRPSASSASATTAHGPAPPAHTTWQATASDNQHRHSHCAFVLSRRQLFAAFLSFGGFLAPPPPRPVVFARLGVPPAAVIAMLRLAPKQSPPA